MLSQRISLKNLQLFNTIRIFFQFFAKYETKVTNCKMEDKYHKNRWNCVVSNSYLLLLLKTLLDCILNVKPANLWIRCSILHKNMHKAKIDIQKTIKKKFNLTFALTAGFSTNLCSFVIVLCCGLWKSVESGGKFWNTNLFLRFCVRWIDISLDFAFCGFMSIN